MSKQEFLADLKAKLSGLPKQEVEERLVFYSEMIDDRIEEGQTEQAAVLGVGPVNEIAAQIIADIPFSKIAKERMKPNRRIGTWEIVLLVLGSPIWFSLAIAAFAVILSLYAVLWSVIVSLWSVFASLAASSVAGVIAGIIFAVMENALSGIFTIGAGLICAGLAIFLFFACKTATKGIILVTKKLPWVLKNALLKRGTHNE